MYKFSVGDKVTDQAFPGREGLPVLDRRVNDYGRTEVLVDHSIFDQGQYWHLDNNLRLWNPKDANPLPWEKES